jgi:hypothetical protein
VRRNGTIAALGLLIIKDASERERDEEEKKANKKKKKQQRWMASNK